MARLDRLVTAKAVAQYASVIGRQFSYELLQAVSELDEATLQRELSRLVEAELVYQRGLAPHATYTFKHALIQDTAYESLLRSTRQSYHRRIAEILTERFPEMLDAQPELLAYHYMEAGLNQQAIGYWHKAGQKAIEQSANVEAITHLTKGLELLETRPETSERTHDELRMLTTLGPAYIATTGYISPEVEDVYNRAYELCRQMGEETQRFSVLAGLRRFYYVRGDFGTAREIGEQLLTMAQDQQEPTLLLEAYWSLSGVLFHLGEFALVQQHLDQAIAIYELQRDGSQTVRHGTIPGIHCLSWLSVTLWMRGYPAQALQRSHQALTQARQQTSSFALDFVLYQTATLHQYCREWTLTHKHVELAEALRSAQGNLHHQSPTTLLRGWVLVMQGNGEQGITVLCQWLNGPGNGQMRPYALLLLAEAYGQLNQVEAGLEALAEGWALIEKIGTYCYESEMYRLKGQLLLQQSPDNHTEAESCFHQAITIAQNQSAKSWELRAATSLAKLWQSQDKRQDAYDLLAPVYGWFTEGFDTADLQDAKALLDELR
jgi:predicted ATPase